MADAALEETIYALSTASGLGGIAVFRVSGARAFDCLAAMTGITSPSPRRATYTRIRCPLSQSVIDHGVIIGFPAPGSFTGEDCVEFHTHGGQAVRQAMFQAFSHIEGLRRAEPGEFTRRAFENGKMDLTEAEAVADLIHAQTELQRRQALTQLSGALAGLYGAWHEKMKRLLAYVEAEIDFPDEDLPDTILDRISGELCGLIDDIGAHLDDNRRGERLRDGLHVAVIGAPNAGKSSLVNAIAQRDVAITSEMPGTTRDVIEAHLDLGGYPIILSDTAGLRPLELLEGGHGKVEEEGIRRALSRAESADMLLLVFDASEKQADPATLELISDNAFVVVNKVDCVSANHLPKLADQQLVLSARTGEGLNDLLKAMERKASELVGRTESPSLTRARHRESLAACLQCLERCRMAEMPELAAEDIRLAMRALGRVTGKVDVEDLLDVIFRDFCIGK